MHGWTIPEWRDAYRNGTATPLRLLGELVAQLRARDDAVWISVATDGQVAEQLSVLTTRSPDLPLYGVPFAVKDNIDVAGWVTTAACPGFAYSADATAPAVQRLLDAGAVLVGKTNLDQFATGLVGTRSPYGAVRNAFNPDYVSGGSSSGSAVAVATGMVPFALGTDTAGSGRVPAGFNNLVGIKPTRGAISSRGVVPACRTLDCISIFALDVADAEAVAQVMYHHDPLDPYGRAAPAASPSVRDGLRLGVPTAPKFYGDAESERAFHEACAGWQALGAELVPLDFGPLHEAADLLYEGPWVAERYAAVGDYIERGVEGIDSTVSAVVLKGRSPSAVDCFRAEYRRAELKLIGDELLRQVDALLVPTAPTHYRLDEMRADPITLNSHFGVYTNFVNLLDWSALALPAGMRGDGLPFGITLIAPAWADQALLDLGYRWQRHRPWLRGALGQPLPVRESAVREPLLECVRLAVVGAHLTGMPLNHQLTDRNARLVERTRTAERYRLYALAGSVPPKPGLVRGDQGAAIEVELWDVPARAFGSFVAAIPAPLGIGTLELIDGRQVKGFICESWAVAGAQEITRFGGWRRFIETSR